MVQQRGDSPFIWFAPWLPWGIKGHCHMAVNIYIRYEVIWNLMEHCHEAVPIWWRKKSYESDGTSLLGVWENIYKLGYEKMRKSKSSDLRNDSTVKEGKRYSQGERSWSSGVKHNKWGFHMRLKVIPYNIHPVYHSSIIAYSSESDETTIISGAAISGSGS